MESTGAGSQRGILGFGAYVPYRRLDRTEIAGTIGTGGGRGRRSVASFDEDTTSMGVEASRVALRSMPDCTPNAVWFSTTRPAYAERTNATVIHAALRLPSSVSAIDMTGAVRTGAASLRAAVESGGCVIAVAADIRTGLPGGEDEATGGDAAAAVVVGNAADGPLLAEYLGGASAVDEFVDRWRAPGEDRIRRWEARFAETMYVPLGEEAWASALDQAGVSADQVALAGVTGVHPRAVSKVAGKLGVGRVVDDLGDGVGFSGAAHGSLLLASMIEQASPGDVIALVALADGAEVMVFRVTDAARSAAGPTVADLAAGGGSLPYAKFLQWRSNLVVEPPNRPEPARPSSSAAARAGDFKYGFVGTRGETSRTVHLPPSAVSIDPADAQMESVDMADKHATVVTFTIDRLVYSLSPPVVFAVVDFDGGGRMPVELTDADETEVEIGARVEMTFRRLFTSDGIHNYFWKGRLIR